MHEIRQIHFVKILTLINKIYKQELFFLLKGRIKWQRIFHNNVKKRVMNTEPHKHLSYKFVWFTFDVHGTTANEKIKECTQ